MSHFPKLHAALIYEFLIETYLYLSNPEFMQQVRALLSLGSPLASPVN